MNKARHIGKHSLKPNFHFSLTNIFYCYRLPILCVLRTRNGLDLPYQACVFSFLTLAQVGFIYIFWISINDGQTCNLRTGRSISCKSVEQFGSNLLHQNGKKFPDQMAKDFAFPIQKYLIIISRFLGLISENFHY